MENKILYENDNLSIKKRIEEEKEYFDIICKDNILILNREDYEKFLSRLIKGLENEND